MILALFRKPPLPSAFPAPVLPMDDHDRTYSNTAVMKLRQNGRNAK